MADYCWQCTEKWIGLDGKDNDMRGLCDEWHVVPVLCEGCGAVDVDHEGRCQGGCLEKHGCPEGCLRIQA